MSRFRVMAPRLRAAPAASASLPSTLLRDAERSRSVSGAEGSDCRGLSEGRTVARERDKGHDRNGCAEGDWSRGPVGVGPVASPVKAGFAKHSQA